MLQGFRTLDLRVNRQGDQPAYFDTFRLVCAFFALVLPLTYLLRRRPAASPWPAAAAQVAKALMEAH